MVGGVVYASMAASLPDPDASRAKGRDQSTVVYDRNGQVLAKIFAEQNRSDKPLSKIPATVRQAVIATEDQRFYEHAGVDPMGIARALLTDAVLGRRAQGGSTITQQYVKNAFVTNERTVKRKIMEAMLANKVERKYKKDQILELYLNTIYFGHGAYGVEAAAQVYFGKGVARLDLAESAMLAGVIKSPGRYSPYMDPKSAQARRHTVLSQMLAQHYITPQQFAAADAEAIKVAGLKPRGSEAPYFVEWVKEQAVRKFGQDPVYRGGLKIYTTLDLNAQKAAEKAVATTLNKPTDPSGALVAIKPSTGEVIAMVGGKDFSTQQFNVAVQGKRQPGSSFKPFVLATALGDHVSPEQTFESGPIKLPVPGGQTWSVTGASNGRKGPMRLREATEQSVNSVFAQLIVDVGPEKVIETAKKMGVQEKLEAVPAIALGGLRTGVSPLEMASAYGTLAAGGQHTDPYGISKVEDAKGNVLLDAKPKVTPALDPAVAYLTTNLLTGVITKGTGKSAQIGRPAAGKTGTTQEYRDAWFVGYTPDLSAAVWVGYPDAQREMKAVHGRKVTGGSYPAAIWAQFMKAALASTPKTQFQKPAGIVSATICLDTGALATEFCPRKGTALFLDGDVPDKCTLHAAPAQVAMPRLIGMTKEAALALLQKLKLSVIKVTETDVAGVSAGTVAQQSPTEGSIATTQTPITIVVSNGGIANQPPKPDFQMPAAAKSGQPVALDGSLSKDDGQIVTWYWEFGDGTTGAGPKVSHTWSAVGSTVDVTLWVTDDHGQQASLTKQIKIQ